MPYAFSHANPADHSHVPATTCFVSAPTTARAFAENRQLCEEVPALWPWNGLQ